MGTYLDRDPDRDRIGRSAIDLEVPDAEPSETQEWLDSVDAVVDHAGRERAQTLIVSLIDRARQRRTPGLGARSGASDPG
jgi:pyruvate dehydrogenase E1 component